MTTFGTILRRAAWLLGGRVASQVLGVAFTVLLASRLGPDGFGGYAFIAALIYVANVVTTFGTDMVLIRELAGDGRRDGWLAALAVQLALTAIAIVAIWGVAWLVPDQPAGVVSALRVLSLSLVPAAAWSVASAILRGTGRIGSLAVLGTSAAALQLGLGWWLVAGPADLVRAAEALVVAQLLAAAAAVGTAMLATDILRPAPGVDRRSITRMLRASAPIGVLGLLGVLYQRVAVLGMTILAGPVATAWFASGSKVVEASKAGHVALYGALYPAMAEAHGRRAAGPDETRAVTGGAPSGRSLWLSVVAAAAISGFLVLVGPVAIRLLFGAAFEPAAAGVSVLAVSILPSTLATYLSLEAVATHHEGRAVWALVSSLVVLVGLVAGLVPAVGWIGACWAVVVAESVQAIGLLAARRGGLAMRGTRAGAARASEPGILVEATR